MWCLSQVEAQTVPVTVVARFHTKLAMAAGIGKKQDNGSLPPERLLRKDGIQGQCSVTLNDNVVIY